MKYFVLVYDQRKGLLQGLEEFPEEAGHAALSRRFELEASHRKEPEIEVVLLGADSREALALTHGRYFKSVKELSAA